MFLTKRVVRPGVLASSLLLLAALAWSGTASAFQGQEEEDADNFNVFLSDSRGIVVTGTGTVTIEPDLAVLSIGVVETAETVVQARAAAAEAMDAMLNALQDAGVAEDDLETSRFAIQPEYQRIGDEQRLTGFRVSNILTVHVRDLDNVGDVIDTAVAAGGDATRIDNISFTVEDPTEAENQARRLAANDAVAKADLYANELGVTRGRLLSLVEAGGLEPPRPLAALEAAAPQPADVPTPIQPGEMDVVVRVQAVFAIQ